MRPARSAGPQGSQEPVARSFRCDRLDSVCGDGGSLGGQGPARLSSSERRPSFARCHGRRRMRRRSCGCGADEATRVERGVTWREAARARRIDRPLCGRKTFDSCLHTARRGLIPSPTDHGSGGMPLGVQRPDVDPGSCSGGIRPTAGCTNGATRSRADLPDPRARDSGDARSTLDGKSAVAVFPGLLSWPWRASGWVFPSPDGRAAGALCAAALGEIALEARSLPRCFAPRLCRNRFRSCDASGCVSCSRDRG